MWLLKRNGPLMTGVALDGNSDNTEYRVVVHTHNLLRRSNFISLTLWSPLQNARGTFHESITLRGHESRWQEACKRLKVQSPVPLNDELNLSTAIAAYNRYISQKRFLIGTPKFLFEDMISLLIWCDRKDEARDTLSGFIVEMSKWDDDDFQSVGGREVFYETLRGIADQREPLGEIYEEQIELLGVGAIPDYGLMFT